MSFIDADGRGVEVDQCGENAVHHRVGKRHDQRRAGDASPVFAIAGCKELRDFGGIPGGGDARAGGTGRRKDMKLYGQEVAVNAEIATMGQFSAHAGKSELLRWMGGCRPRRSKRI